MACTDCTPVEVLYTTQGCKDSLQTACIFYNGPNISALNIQTGDKFNDILKKLSDIVIILTQSSLACPTLSNVVITRLTSSSISVSYTTSNPEATFKYSLDGGDLSSILSNPFTLSELSSESHSVSVKAIDLSNEICAEDSDTIDLSIDSVNHFSIGWSATDPFVNTTTGPTFTVQSTGNVVNNQINADFHLMPSQYFPIIKVDGAASVFNIWYDTPFNNGNIPDSVWREPFLINGVDRYYIGRNPTDFDTTSNHTILIS